MHYKESKEILEKIKKAKRIVTECHRTPDADSIASALVLKKILDNLNKEVTVICCQQIPENFNFIKGVEEIKTVVFDEFPFEEYDLFINIDAENLLQVGFSKEVLPEIEVINIDHHYSNRIRGNIDLIDSKSSSTCEILFYLLNDWDIKIDQDLAQKLITGICSDTGFFQFSSAYPNTLRTVADLMELGGNINTVVFDITRQNSLDFLQLTGEFLTRAQVDVKHKFVWSAIPYEVVKKYNVKDNITSYVSSMLLRTIVDTNFCMAIIETSPGMTKVSMRERVPEADVFLIGKQVNGGGHKHSAGGFLQDVPFEKAVAIYLKAARQYGKNEKTTA